jgi:hypothetical protein
MSKNRWIENHEFGKVGDNNTIIIVHEGGGWTLRDPLN